MKLRGVDFGPVWAASGVQGFFGEGYWFHRFWKPFGLDFDGVTFVAKTTTLGPNVGNMPLKRDFTPEERFPKCIVVKPFQGAVLNSVGLSGPGAMALFRRGLWQLRRDPFFISFMSIAKTSAERLEELRRFVIIFKGELRYFRAPVGLQINYSCPNVGLHAEELVGEVSEGLAIASELGVPIVPKFNAVLPVEVAAEISAHTACDGICVSNTIPWGQLSDEINWEEIFGTKDSPLRHLGGGGLSSAELLSLVISWIRRGRRAGLKKPINGGGGIHSREDGRFMFGAGADSIFVGSVAILRPWRVRGIVEDAHNR